MGEGGYHKFTCHLPPFPTLTLPILIAYSCDVLLLEINTFDDLLIIPEATNIENSPMQNIHNFLMLSHVLSVKPFGTFHFSPSPPQAFFRYFY